MQQKLAVLSMLLLMIMVGASTVMVAAHVTNKASPSNAPVQVLPGVQTSVTTSATTTSTNSTSTTSSSLLVTNPQPAGGYQHCEDDCGSGSNGHPGHDD